MGLTWAFGWAVAGLLIGVASVLLPGLPWDGFFEVFDAPLPALAVPGFFAGVFFSVVLGIAGPRRRFRELSLPRFAAWGALGGVLLILFPFALESVGLASREGSHIGTWQILAAITGPFVLLSALSASVTLAVARAAEGSGSRDAGEDVADVDLTEGEAHELLGAGRPSRHTDRAARTAEPARVDPANGPSDD
jgi:hypothetical protein